MGEPIQSKKILKILILVSVILTSPASGASVENHNSTSIALRPMSGFHRAWIADGLNDAVVAVVVSNDANQSIVDLPIGLILDNLDVPPQIILTERPRSWFDDLILVDTISLDSRSIVLTLRAISLRRTGWPAATADTIAYIVFGPGFDSVTVDTLSPPGIEPWAPVYADLSRNALLWPGPLQFTRVVDCGSADADGDLVAGPCDNCPAISNPDQEDNDFDGVGDSCDNCYRTFNIEQVDSDSDGNGDACDECEGFDDNADRDGDGTPDGCDPGIVYVVHAIDTEPRAWRSDVYSQDLWLTDFDTGEEVARTLTESYRHANRDGFGQPIKLSWFLMSAQALFSTTQGDPSIILSRMNHYYDEARSWGDHYGWHYHHHDWIDSDSDGVYWWEQLKTFDHHTYSHGTDVEIAERSLTEVVVEKKFYPATFRSGWIWMNNGFSNWLDSIVPFDFSNGAPLVRETYDWGRAPSDWSFYRPKIDDYQSPGSMNRVVFRCYASTSDFASAFDRAEGGEDCLTCVSTHSYQKPSQNTATFRLNNVSADYPGVHYKYVNALEGARLMLGLTDTIEPRLEILRNNEEFRITADEPLFAPPYVAVRTLYGDYVRIRPMRDSSSLGLEWVCSLASIPWECVVIAAIDPAGNSFVSNEFHYDSVPTSVPLSDEDQSSLLLSDVRVWPNPFNPTARISFSLQREAVVRLEIFNIVGQRVATLLERSLTSGSHTFEWNAMDTSRGLAASGIYFYRLSSDQAVLTGKLLLVR